MGADDRPQGVGLDRAARVEVDESHARSGGASGRHALAADLLAAGLPCDTVVVDEIGLVGLVEPRRRKLQPDRAERSRGAAGRLGQREIRDVERSERARAGDREEIETRRASRVLRSPPRFHRGDVADDPGRELTEPVGPAGRPDVDHVHCVAERRVRQPVDGRRAGAAPRHRDRRVCGRRRAERGERRQTDEQPLHAEQGTYRFWEKCENFSAGVARALVRSTTDARGRSARRSRLGTGQRSAGRTRRILPRATASSPPGTGVIRCSRPTRRAESRKASPTPVETSSSGRRSRAAVQPEPFVEPGQLLRARAASPALARNSASDRTQLCELEWRQVDEPGARLRTRPRGR